jgi:hypothetical protein
MALSDATMARLNERQVAERRVVRDLTRRYDRATAAAELARESLASAEAERSAVVADWAAISGWTPERIAEITGLTVREVADSVRPRGQRRPPTSVGADSAETAPANVLGRPSRADNASGAAPHGRTSVA